MLTKSLHTITAVTQVARHLMDCKLTVEADDTVPGGYRAAHDLARAALGVLGYHWAPTQWEAARLVDPTVQRCELACLKLMGEADKQRAADARAALVAAAMVRP